MEIAEDLVTVGQALSHQARVRILGILAEGERCGCELAEIIGLDPSVVSRHLSLLSAAGLIVSRREGPRLLWRLAHPEIPAILRCLARLTCERGENDVVADHLERI
ncbi:MAG: ArsR/SmtB family transcription factor [Candidatus Bipolaricaulaceae bacterium]